jgi:hypothetical protein
MAIITKEDILKGLRVFNPWWVNESVNKVLVKEHKRL